MKWMNNIKIVASNFGYKLRGNEREGGNLTRGQKTAPLIGDESRWNRKAVFLCFVVCRAERLQARCFIRLSKQMQGKGFNNAPKSC